MNFHFGNKTQPGDFYYFEIYVGPNPESFEDYVTRLFAGVGLKTKSTINAFDNFMGQAFFRSMVRRSQNQGDIANAVRNPKGRKIKIKVVVYPSIVRKLRKFGINLRTERNGKASFDGYAPVFGAKVKKYERFRPVPDSPVANWSALQKFDAVVKRAILNLPGDVGEELLALLDPVAIGIAVGVVVVWAASHFFGVGQIADVVLLIVGVISLGPVAWTAGKHLIDFAIGTVEAKNEVDLDTAARHLSDAAAMLGVQVIMALLLKKAPKVLNEPRVLMNRPVGRPFTIKTVGEPPTTAGKLFYELPEIEVMKRLPYAGREVPGSTNQWGQSKVFPRKGSTPKDIELAKFHEEFHRLLAPKFQLFPQLRQARAVLRMNSYLKSYLLRYIEEALAETIARMRSRGFKVGEIWEGIKFPVGNDGYVTIAKMRVEAKGILLGPLNVGGMMCNAFYAATEEW